MFVACLQTEASGRVEGSSDKERVWNRWRNLRTGLHQGGQQGRGRNLGGAAPLQTRVGSPSFTNILNNLWKETPRLLSTLARCFPTLPFQHPFVCPHQPALESAGQKVPSDQVPKVHLHHLHPKLPWPELAHHLCVSGGRDEGSVHRPTGLWRHEPQSWRYGLFSRPCSILID